LHFMRQTAEHTAANTIPEDGRSMPVKRKRREPRLR